MGAVKELMIEAADALSAVQRHIDGLEEDTLGGSVDEVLHIGDGFLVMYTVTMDDDDDKVLRFAVDSENEVTVIEASEYDLCRNDSIDLSRSIPELMDLMQEQDPM